SLVLRHVLEAGFTGTVHAVNRAAEDVQGLTAHRSLADIGEPVDLVVVAVPADEVEALIPEAAAAGAQGLVVLTSGYADAGAEGLEAQRRLVSLARAHGMRVIGPASTGLVRTDPAIRLNASPSPGLAQRGPVSLFSQSGAVGAMVSAGVKRRGVGISTSISAGNRADVSGNDAMQFFEADPHTAAVGVYLESFGNPRKFSRIARRLSRTKPVVVVRSDVTGRFLPPGHETRTTQAPGGTVDSMLDQTGVLEAHTHEAMLDILMAVASQPLPTGHRVVLVADSLALDRLGRDAAAEAGLEVTATVGLVGSEQGIAPPADTLVSAVRDAVCHEQADAVVVLARLGLHQADDEPMAVLGALADYVHWRHQEVGEPLEPTGLHPHEAEELVEAAAARAEGTELVRLSDEETETLLGHYGITVLPSVRFETAEEAVAAAERLGFPVALKAVDPHLRHRL
ncbi:GNAT family N-acetyltransferase, partial [Micrococcus luteus]|nr:GNAT family N-acetyltransferase [Micrococcus luteus]